MKKRKSIKIIFNAFLSFILILLFFYGDLHVYAETVSIPFIPKTSTGTYVPDLYVEQYFNGSWRYFDAANVRLNSSYSINFEDGYTYRLSCYVGNNQYIYSMRYNGVGISRVESAPTVITDFSYTIEGRTSDTAYTAIYSYISIPSLSTPTPEPTPTPTPAPTPTPLPVDYDDTQFWGRMNDMAEGGWSALTAAFNGIFNNTVLRNLVVYVPLFGAIIYLFVYLLFMGSD